VKPQYPSEIRQALKFLDSLLEKRQDIGRRLDETVAASAPPLPPFHEAAPPVEPLSPAEENAGYEEADQLIAAGRLDEALEQLEKLAARGAIRWDIYNDLGTLQLNTGHVDEAFRSLKTAASLEFSSTQALRNLIVAYVQQGEVANALAATGLLLRKERHDPDILGFLENLLVEANPRLDDYSWLSAGLAATLDDHAQLKAQAAVDAHRHLTNQHKAELYDWASPAKIEKPDAGKTSAQFWSPPSPIDHREQPSCIVFLPPTCGGASVYRVLSRLSSNFYHYLNLEVDAMYSNDPYKGEVSAMHGFDYQLTGAIYSWREASRLAMSLQNSALRPEDFRHLIVLRDPRDSLVSLYHILKDPSYIPPKELTAFQQAAVDEKQRLQSISLDQYVLEGASTLCQNITVLAELLKNVPPERIEFLSYAVLCEDFPQFIKRLTCFLQIVPENAVLQEMLLGEDVKKKDSLSYYSMARLPNAAPMPGRHKRELKPETIAKLNGITAEARHWMASLETPEYRHLYDD